MLVRKSGFNYIFITQMWIFAHILIKKRILIRNKQNKKHEKVEKCLIHGVQKHFLFQFGEFYLGHLASSVPFWIIGVNIKEVFFGKQPLFGIRRLLCVHVSTRIMTCPTLWNPHAAQRCSWQSYPCVHCSDMKMPPSPPEYMNYELWLALKALSPAGACRLSNPLCIPGTI